MLALDPIRPVDSGHVPQRRPRPGSAGGLRDPFGARTAGAGQLVDDLALLPAGDRVVPLLDVGAGRGVMPSRSMTRRERALTAIVSAHSRSRPEGVEGVRDESPAPLRRRTPDPTRCAAGATRSHRPWRRRGRGRGTRRRRTRRSRGRPRARSRRRRRPSRAARRPPGRGSSARPMYAITSGSPFIATRSSRSSSASGRRVRRSVWRVGSHWSLKQVHPDGRAPQAPQAGFHPSTDSAGREAGPV